MHQYIFKNSHVLTLWFSSVNIFNKDIYKKQCKEKHTTFFIGIQEFNRRDTIIVYIYKHPVMITTQMPSANLIFIMIFIITLN